MKFALWCWRLNGFSGVERYVVDLSRALVAAGHGVEVFVNHFGGQLADLAAAHGATLRSWDDRYLDPPDLNIAQVKAPTDAALLANRAPIVQVVHSEHPHEAPLEDARVPCVVFVRLGARHRMLAELPWLRGPTKRTEVIRNPVHFDDFRRIPPMAPSVAGVFCSEIDAFKMRFLKAYARDAGGPVLVVGRLMDEALVTEIPQNVEILGPRLYPGWYYGRGKSAFSFRLSRTVVEAHLCGRAAMVYGGLEPAADAFGASNVDPEWINPGDIDISEFEAAVVAARWIALAQEVVACKS